ncbi:MAG: signal peptidase I [Bacilli bacterium]|nr:signal peptidase I [Bacilli bacterium]
MFRKIKNILLRIIYILLIIYLLIFVPTLWGKKPLVIVSGSMEPVLKVGGIVYYKDYAINDFKEGDIVVYKIPSDIISHRLVNITDNGLITKGDMNNTYDNILITEDIILGLANNWSIAYIGYYAHFIYTHKYLLIITILLIITDVIVEKYQSKKKVISNEKS